MTKLDFHPIVRLTRRARFAASHRLHVEDLADEDNQKIFGKCNHIHGHGHNYELFVTVKAPINPVTGIVMNIDELKLIIQHAVLDKVDHKHLNLDVPEFKEFNPTAEMMAVVFWDWIEPHLPENSLEEVKVKETENNIASYRGETHV